MARSIFQGDNIRLAEEEYQRNLKLEDERIALLLSPFLKEGVSIKHIDSRNYGDTDTLILQLGDRKLTIEGVDGGSVGILLFTEGEVDG